VVHLEADVQVGARGVAGHAVVSDLLTGSDAATGVHDGRVLHVVVEPQPSLDVLDDDGVSAGAVRAGEVHLAAHHGVDRGTHGGGQVDSRMEACYACAAPAVPVAAGDVGV